MANGEFSDVFLRSLPPPLKGQKAYWDGKLPSFGVRVSQGGSKTFILNRHNTFITIGRYGIITLAKAREEARHMLAEFTLGKVRPQSITYPRAVEAFVEDKKKTRRLSTALGYEWLLNRFPYRGQLGDITTDDLSRTLRGIKSPSTREHTLIAARIFFNWALKHRYVERNPTAPLTAQVSKPRKRILSDEELKAVWNAAQPSSYYGAIVRLLILTGQRRGEIAALKPEYLRGDLCELPPSLTKNNRSHTFPLGAKTMELLSAFKGESGFLFPARGSKLTSFCGWSKSKGALDKSSGVTNWCLHDLRRTYRSTIAKLGIPAHIGERLLNHIAAVTTDVQQVYDTYSYLPEMREAVEKYETHLLKLLAS